MTKAIAWGLGVMMGLGDSSGSAPAAVVSVLCRGLNLGLLRYLYGLER